MASNLIVCGGTFDHFHKGHEAFLRYAFSVGKKVIVGLTSDEYVKSSKFKVQSSKSVESFEKRKQAVLEFIKAEGILNKTEIIEINDMFGPTLSKELKVDAIVISGETRKGADMINQKRKELGLVPLKIFVAPAVYAEDGKLISSGRIRNGEINREGKLYVKKLWFNKNLKLTENLRKELQKPFGELLKDAERFIRNINNLVITVGDVTTKKFNESPIKQNISVVDFKVARKVQFSSFSELGFLGGEKIITADNPPSHITCDLFSKVLYIFKSNFDKAIILKIAGEEDLAVLPLILVAPLNTIVYYGQPNMGLIKVKVTEKSKDQAYNLVSKFKPI